MTYDPERDLRGAATLLAVEIGDVIEAVARVDKRAEDVHSRIERLAAMHEGEDGDSLLRHPEA